MREKLRLIYRHVRHKAGKAMCRQKKTYDHGKVREKLAPGQLVWFAQKNRTKGKSPKLQRKWVGPRLIVERLTDVTYVLAESATKRKVVHFDLVKPYRGLQNPLWAAKMVREKAREQVAAARLGVAYNPDSYDDEVSAEDDNATTDSGSDED
jgi:hypothetical protein